MLSSAWLESMWADGWPGLSLRSPGAEYCPGHGLRSYARLQCSTCFHVSPKAWHQSGCLCCRRAAYSSSGRGLRIAKGIQNRVTSLEAELRRSAPVSHVACVFDVIGLGTPVPDEALGADLGYTASTNTFWSGPMDTDHHGSFMVPHGIRLLGSATVMLWVCLNYNRRSVKDAANRSADAAISVVCPLRIRSRS